MIKTGCMMRSDNGAYYSEYAIRQLYFKVRVTGNDRQTVLAETSIRLHVEQTVWLQWVGLFLSILYSCFYYRYRVRYKSSDVRTAWGYCKGQTRERGWGAVSIKWIWVSSTNIRAGFVRLSRWLWTCEGHSWWTNDLNGDTKQLLQIVNLYRPDIWGWWIRCSTSKNWSDAKRLQRGRYGCSAIHQNITSIFSLNAEQKISLLRLSGADGPFRAWIDVEQTGEDTQFSFSDAMKFTPAGGQIEVSLKSDGKACWNWSVSDTGPGIPEE